MNIRIWKQLSVFTLLGLFLSWLISCSSANIGSGVQQSGAGSTEVEFWTMQLQPQFTDYFQHLIATFETENPGVKVRWVDVPWTAMQSKILTSISAKTAPDVVNLNPDFASQLAGRHVWLNLDDKVQKSVRSTYLPNIWKASTLNGKSFGIPWYLTTQLTVYNTELLHQAGISHPPVTYAELATVAQQIKQKTGKYVFFITLVPEDSAEVLESFVQMGVNLVDERGSAAFNTPQGKAAFQYWVDLYKKGLLPQEVLTQGHRHGIELYQAGETVLLSTGSESINTIAKNAPAIAKVSAIAPQLTGETGKKSVAVMDLVIPHNSDRANAAVQFALFVTNNQNQLTFAKAANVLPSTIQALNNSYFQPSPTQDTLADKARIISASQMKQAEVLIPTIKDLNLLQKAIYENLQAAMLGEKTVDQAIADAAQEWNQRG
ncbi:MAG: sugar ABC transporter substrate-binding protein [Chroococcidiopsidaceae cyanobacterium CP_BM_ER_R8_30]|nr:sugar ABC transporter substrate-binding protein [Chroococcidiopsidaceae cyanobacterium CP_BM_ER_R8_30]